MLPDPLDLACSAHNYHVHYGVFVPPPPTLCESWIRPWIAVTDEWYLADCMASYVVTHWLVQ